MDPFKPLIKKILNIKNFVVENYDVKEEQGNRGLHIYLRQNKRYQFKCPFCQKSCPIYDGKSSEDHSTWRGLDWGGLRVYLHFSTCRVSCPDHGVKTCLVPWAFPGSHFTRDFDLTVARLDALKSRLDLSKLFGIDWKTVGRCVERVRDFYEKEPTKNFENLTNISIDEINYLAGHNALIAVVNLDNNSVVWSQEGDDQETLSLFFEQLSEKQRNKIKMVTINGNKWISACVEKYIPHATLNKQAFLAVNSKNR